jgi:surfeit locus 1 family protein
MKNKIFHIFCLLTFVGCINLGIWQINRMQWKEALIEQVEKYKNANPELFNFENFDQQKDLFKKVFMNGKFIHEHEFLLSAKYFSENRDKNELGYHVITPFLTTDGVIVFVNRGWIPEKIKQQKDRPDSLYIGNVESNIEGIIRESAGKAPWYMPQNMPEKNVWFWIEIPAMIKYLKDNSDLQNIRPVLIQQTIRTTNNDFKYPITISANLEFYNQHFMYVLTWFSMAGVIFIMWVIYVRKNRKKPVVK